MKVRGLAIAFLGTGCVGAMDRQHAPAPASMPARSMARVLQLITPDSGPELDGLQLGSTEPPPSGVPWRCKKHVIHWSCESADPSHIGLAISYYQNVLEYAYLYGPGTVGDLRGVCEIYNTLKARLTERVGKAGQQRNGPCESQTEEKLYQDSCTSWKAQGRKVSVSVTLNPERLTEAHLVVYVAREGVGAGECDKERTSE
jgi:hypothetical protein